MTLCGRVQGVGFRPFVYRIARKYGLNGYVQNRLGEVHIVACGPHSMLQRFYRDLVSCAPPLAEPSIARVLAIDLPNNTAATQDFRIITSLSQSDARIFVPPDFFMCDDCRRELHDPHDRRYRYPFINCTQCGPRYTLIERLPYDRPNTSMSDFPLCSACEAEYRDPNDRRFHAEPVACPACGPQVSFVNDDLSETINPEIALESAIERLRDGQILAVKGVGGYHLMCDACDERAVGALRRSKHRPAKPFAIMMPQSGADGLDAVRQHATLRQVESDLLVSPARPIVLVAKTDSSCLASNIAPGLNEFGVFLPYTPLHHILLEEFDGPLVATSANISGEPVLTDNEDVEKRLASVADAYLHHDRRIVRPADDPVYRRVSTTMRPLRIGRGCAPIELQIPWHQKQPVLAVGGHMKGTLALSWDDRVVVSPHIGEMDSPRSLAVFEQVADDLQQLYGVTAERVVCDAHPGYTTHRWAHKQSLPIDTVWHHRAHASALTGELDLPGWWLVFTWDGVGFGEDGTLWGAEGFVGKPGDWRRVGSVRPFRIPGGDRAGREPWRSAAALLWDCGRSWPGIPDDDGLVRSAWEQDLNCRTTSSAGRLFDAAATFVTGQARISFEAQGPMCLEALCKNRAIPVGLPLTRGDDDVWRADWEPLLATMLNTSLTPAVRAEIFHSSLANMLLQQALAISGEYSIDRVGLCGGVFQNRALTEHAVDLLKQEGFRVCLSQKLPCNDAALSFGQAVEHAARSR